MKILISGVAGFIGSNLSRALLKEGHTIYGLDNLSVGNHDYLPEGISFFIYGKLENYPFFNKGALPEIHDVSNSEDIKYNFENLDLIIHLASRKIPREGNPDRVLRENALGTMKVVEMAQKYNARIIYLSSSEVYGRNHKCSEDSSFIFDHPENPRWSYGLSKLWSENYLFGSSNIKFNIIRLFATYGPWNCRHWRAGPVPVFIEQALDKKPFTIHGDGLQIRAFQYIDDAINGILGVINKGSDRQIYNIGNPYEPISILSLAYMIYEEIRGLEKLDITYIKDWGNKEKITYRIPETKLAYEKLGFVPNVSMKEGLKKTIEWHKKIRKPGDNAV